MTEVLSCLSVGFFADVVYVLGDEQRRLIHEGIISQTIVRRAKEVAFMASQSVLVLQERRSSKDYF